MSTLLVFKLLSFLLSFMGGEILIFESRESKTQAGDSVYNKISLVTSDKRDIWHMKQSHHGAQFTKWDTIKIVVDKTTSPKRASFHQLNKAGREIEYSVSCYKCHPNGPRLIRPKKLKKLRDKITALKWNMRIKSYGEIIIKNNEPFIRHIKLIEDHAKSKETLKLKSCTSCHYAGGPRAKLTKSNVLTIKHLVKEKSMPPWPYKISKKEKAQLNRFIYGY